MKKSHQLFQDTLPLFISIIAGICILVISAVVYFTWRCWRTRRTKISEDSSPDPDYPETQRSINMKISQSTPDLIDEVQPEVTENEERIGRNLYKTVIKQSTLPTIPQRHLTFQRQLSHKLDFSNVEFTIQSVKYKEQPDAGKLKPELYRQTVQETATLTQDHVKNCGRLKFALKYEHSTECLVVSIISAENLPAKDFSGTSDPYVKIYLLPDRKRKYQTKVHRKTLFPEFNEKFAFNVPYSNLASRTLQFSVIDFDRFSRHDLIGVVMIRDVAKNLDLSWEQQYTMDIMGVNQEKADLGELMLSLCYLPTAGRLTITIIKSRNLKAMDITGTSDPYVKVSLMCHGRRIKKKKTSVKRSTLNPVYNEAIVFDVPQENIEEVSLVIKVIDYDRVGSNELMGCCALGPLYMGVGRDHWYEMLESPRKPIAVWYPLVENVPGVSHDHTPNGKREPRGK